MVFLLRVLGELELWARELLYIRMCICLVALASYVSRGPGRVVIATPVSAKEREARVRAWGDMVWYWSRAVAVEISRCGKPSPINYCFETLSLVGPQS